MIHIIRIQYMSVTFQECNYALRILLVSVVCQNGYNTLLLPLLQFSTNSVIVTCEPTSRTPCSGLI